MVAGWPAFLAVVLLPGAWIAFGLRLPGVSIGMRCALGVLLGPLVVGVELYALRLGGVGFHAATWAIVLGNLPAGLLGARRWRQERRPDGGGETGAAPPGTVAASAVVLAVAFASFAPRLTAVEDRSFTGHAWMHADVVYQIADGALVPEDSTLAGYRLSYPWGGHVYQAVLSRALGTAPVSNWIWTNLAWLLAVCALAGGVTGALGGGAVARAATIAALLFAVNPLGWIGMEVSRLQGWQNLLPRGVAEIQSVWGDPRYTPWALKFLFFNQMPFGLGFVAGLLYVGTQVADGRGDAGRLTLTALLLASLGVIYPILLPAGAAVVGAAGLAPLLRAETRTGDAWKRFAALAAVGVVAGAIAVAHLDFVTRDRVAGAGALSPRRLLAMKLVAETLALSLLLAATAAVARRCGRARPTVTTVLLLAAAASFLTHLGIHIAYWMNEYKFVFTAAMCLAPFAGTWFEGATGRMRRGSALAVLGTVTAVLAFPLVRPSWWGGPWGVPPELRPIHEVPDDRPRLDTGEFALRLRERPALDRLVTAVREKTPANAVVVTPRADVHLPTLMQRSLYAPPPEKISKYGINRLADYLIVRVRGYPRRALRGRMETVASLYEGDEGERGRALARIQELGRPVAILLDDEADAATETWLSVRGTGRVVYRGDGTEVWLEEAAGGR